jgi:hypothetical protein
MIERTVYLDFCVELGLGLLRLQRRFGYDLASKVLRGTVTTVCNLIDTRESSFSEESYAVVLNLSILVNDYSWG